MNPRQWSGTPPSTHLSRLYYTPQEVGNLAGFSASFIVQEIKAGELPATLVIPPGRRRGRWRITIADAHAYVQRLHARTTI